MRVGVLGSGDVGRVLAGGFLTHGHEVKIGSRDPEKLSDWAQAAGERGSTGTFEDAARFGELLVLATLGVAAESAIAMADADNFAGKVLIDATNPLDFSPGMLPKLSVGHSDSLGERVQRWAPEARVVKAFNTVGNALMVNPQLPGGPPDMFVCGNDDDAKRLVSEVCKQFGWGTIDIGTIEGARYLEPLCMIWVLHGIRSGSWNHAFKLLRK